MAAQNPKEDVKIPRSVQNHIRDMVEPIVVKRSMIWQTVAIFAAAIVVGIFTWIFYFAPPSGDDLVNDIVTTAGGIDNWDKIDGGVFTRTRYLYDENGTLIDTRPTVYYFSKGDDGFKIVLDTETPGGKVVIGYDGDEFWATEGGEPANPPDVARPLGMMCASDRCSPTCAAEMAFYRFSLPFKLQDPGVVPRYAGTSQLNGRIMQLLEITYEENVGRDRWVLFADKETKLVHKVEHYRRKDGSEPPEEIYWSDHAQHAGITFSHRNTYYRSNGSKLEEYVISDVDFTSPLPENTFRLAAHNHDHHRTVQ